MITTTLINYHEKALKILEMIERAQVSNHEHRQDIKRLEQLPFWHPYRDNIKWHAERIKMNAAIIERLHNSYTALMQKVVFQVASKQAA